MTKPDDDSESLWRELALRSQRGDRDAYRDLLQCLAPAIKRYLQRRFGRQAFVDDCTQESLIAIHHALPSYNTQRAFRPWLYAIVRYRTIDWLRADHRQRVASFKASEDEEVSDTEPALHDPSLSSRRVDVGVSMPVASPEVDQVRALSCARLINGLPKKYAQPLVMTKLYGLSIAETAIKLELSEPAVKQRVKRAIDKLKASWRIEGDL